MLYETLFLSVFSKTHQDSEKSITVQVGGTNG